MPYFSREIRYFEQVAKTKSVRAASTVLNIAPSAISRAVQQLEYEMGFSLFDRTVRGLHLTAAGEILLSQMQRWERESHQLDETLRSLSGHQLQTLRVATIEAASYELIPNAMSELRGRVPGLEIDLRVGDTPFILDAVINGTADLGVVINLPKTAPVERLWTVRNPVGIVTKRGRRLPTPKPTSVADCSFAPLILPAEGLAARTAIKSALNAAEHLRVAGTSNRIIAIKSILRNGDAVSILTRMDAASEIADGTLTFLELKEESVEHPYVSIIAPRKTSLSAATQLMVGSLKGRLPLEETTS